MADKTKDKATAGVDPQASSRLLSKLPAKDAEITYKPKNLRRVIPPWADEIIKAENLDVAWVAPVADEIAHYQSRGYVKFVAVGPSGEPESVELPDQLWIRRREHAEAEMKVIHKRNEDKERGMYGAQKRAIRDRAAQMRGVTVIDGGDPTNLETAEDVDRFVKQQLGFPQQ